MRKQFNSVKNPTPAALLAALFFSPLAGYSQIVHAGSGQPYQANNADVTGLVGQLQHNALLSLLGAVALMAFVYIWHVSKACADLRSLPRNKNNSFIMIVVLALGTSAFCSSCSVEQEMMAARYREMTESTVCPMGRHHEDPANAAFNNRYPYNGYSRGNNPTHCKYCGQITSGVRR